MLGSCHHYCTLDSLRTYLLELCDMYQIDSFSRVAKRQKILYSDTVQ